MPIYHAIASNLGTQVSKPFFLGVLNFRGQVTRSGASRDFYYGHGFASEVKNNEIRAIPFVAVRPCYGNSSSGVTDRPHLPRPDAGKPIALGILARGISRHEPLFLANL
jgi:hypothetical protein